jgi:hypothetical protein
MSTMQRHAATPRCSMPAREVLVDPALRNCAPERSRLEPLIAAVLDGGTWASAIRCQARVSESAMPLPDMCRELVQPAANPVVDAVARARPVFPAENGGARNVNRSQAVSRPDTDLQKLRRDRSLLRTGASAYPHSAPHVRYAPTATDVHVQIGGLDSARPMPAVTRDRQRGEPDPRRILSPRASTIYACRRRGDAAALLSRATQTSEPFDVQLAYVVSLTHMLSVHFNAVDRHSAQASRNRFELVLPRLLDSKTGRGH